MITEHLTVPEIHCGHCKEAIEGALRPMEGVTHAAVDVDEHRVTVTFDEQALGLADIVAAISEQGYEVPPEDLDLP